MMMQLAKYLPILDWGRYYDRSTLTNDLVAALIVTIMLIPQSLAYALLAGLPPEMGLYASMLPIIFYAIFGTSRALAVGPVAVVSLLTVAAVSKIAVPGTSEYIVAAITLAFLSGLILFALGLFRLGFLANFLSHPVIAGFITATGVIIAVSQLKNILGIDAHGHTIPDLSRSLAHNLSGLNWITAVIGVVTTGFLFWVRKGLLPLLDSLGVAPRIASIIVKAGPIAAIVATTLVVWFFDLTAKGVQVVGDVPKGLPPFTMPSLSMDMWSNLIGAAILISIIGFIESVSVAQTLAAKKRQRIDPDQELIGLGAANLGASLTGGFPVTGGFSRSVVNYDAGADTPAAGAYTAIGLAGASLFLTPLIFHLPKATLAATIIVAVLSLVDFSVLKKTWHHSKADFAAVISTISITLLMGVELGVSAGVTVSILIHLYKSSRPHMAIVGQVPKTEHYRNILRHDVLTDPKILTIRVDESLYFANTRYLEDRIYDEVAQQLELQHVVLMCSAVNTIDMSALQSLEAINERLYAGGVTFHFSELKGPVMDQLSATGFLDVLSGEVFLSQHNAQTTLRVGSDL
ncbi:MAG TPA: sodium-independent anion transporter [Rhodobacteraceae bacterium]|jgi:SulP family sulfate permease|nr:sodium-independent anion transporter [Paracoccaceae bacterium]|tara:strand:- start:101 stop:1825 length:1725 start_codon:yes stop_codon:yes gene_type:complete